MGVEKILKMRPGGKVKIFTIYIPLILDMIQTKNGNNWPCSLREKSKKCKIVNGRHMTNNTRRWTKINGNRSTECCATFNAVCFCEFDSLEDLEQKGVTSKQKNNKTLSSHYSNGKSMILKHTAADRLICFPT